MRFRKGLSLVIPCYREAPHLKSSYRQLNKTLQRLRIPYELLFIDDKSPDDTKKIIVQICDIDSNARGIFHSRNKGRGATVKDGILAAQYSYSGFIDIDLEISQRYIAQCIDHLVNGSDMVIARRTYPFHIRSLYRILASRGYHYLSKIFLGLPFRDTEAGFKFFKTEKILKLLPNIHDKHWFWDTEIVAQGYFNDLKITEVDVIFNKKHEKKSTVKIIPDSISYARNVISYKRKIGIPLFPWAIHFALYAQDLKSTAYLALKHIFFPLRRMDKILPKSGVIVDIGCAEGILSSFLGMRSPYRSIIGIDLSRARLKTAQNAARNLKNVRYGNRDVTKGDIPRATAVVAADFLHHISFDKQAILLKKCHRVLEDDGMLLIKEVDKHAGWRYIMSRLFDLFLYPEDVIYYRSVREWKSLLTKIGFTSISSVKAVSWAPFSTVLYVCRK